MVSEIITNIDYKIVDYDEYKDKPRKNFLMPESLCGPNSVGRFSNQGNRVESRFIEPPRETKIVSKNWMVRVKLQRLT